MEDFPTLSSLDDEFSDHDSSVAPSEKSSSAQHSNTPPLLKKEEHKKRPGRKKKKFDSDYEEESAESRVDSPDYIDDGGSDPDYSDVVDVSFSKRPRRIRKRGFSTYNVNRMVKEEEAKKRANFEQEKGILEKRKRGRPPKYGNAADRPSASAAARISQPAPASRPLNSLKNIMLHLEPPREHDYLTVSGLKNIIPWPLKRCSFPSPEARVFVSQVELREAIRTACGGFRRFVKSISDQVLLDMLNRMQQGWDVDGADDYVKLSQVMRVVWNMLDEETRLAWEFMARDEIRRQHRAKIASIEREQLVKRVSKSAHSVRCRPKQEEGTEECCAENLNGGGKQEEDVMDADEKSGRGSKKQEIVIALEANVNHAEDSVGACSFKDRGRNSLEEELTDEALGLMPQMAHCEQTFIAGGIEKTRPDRVVFSCPLCLEEPEQMYTFSEILRHMSSCHFSGIHYGCHLCGKAFSTVDELSCHSCEHFSKYMLERLLVEGAKAGTLHMKCAWMYLACVDCGLCVPISSQFDITGHVATFEKQWKLLIRTFTHHNCDGLVPLVVYMPEVPDASLEEIRFSVVPTMCLSDIPTCCAPCGVESFASPAEVECHFKEFHGGQGHTCVECGEQFGTRPFYVSHCLLHLPKSIILADYLSTQCRFFPPPGDECSAPMLGFKVGGNASYPLGGTGKLSRGFVAEYVQPFEGTLYSKMIQAELVKKAQQSERKKKIEEGESSETDNEEEKGAPDFGYEHVGRLWIDEPRDEKSNRHKVAEYFKENSEARSFLMSSETRLFNDRETTSQLGLGAYDEIPEGRKVPFSLSTRCSFADQWVASVARTLTIPIQKPLSDHDLTVVGDYLLYDDRIYYCHCGTICKGAETAGHAKRCFLEGVSAADLDLCDKISCIFSPFWPSDSRVYCLEPGCSASACGISGFRAHLLAAHTVYAPFIGDGKSVSLMNRAQTMVYRTKSAQLADEAIGVRADGLLRRIAKRQSGAIPGTTRDLSYVKTTRVGNGASVSRPGSVASTAATNTTEIRPFRSSRTSKNVIIYECNMCNFRTEHTRSCPAHIIQNHTEACNACGAVFVKTVTREMHQLQSCPVSVPQQLRESLRARCPCCGFVDRLRHVIFHLVNVHYTKIRFDRLEGTVKPLIAELVLTGNLPLPPATPGTTSAECEVIEIGDDEPPSTGNSGPTAASWSNGPLPPYAPINELVSSIENAEVVYYDKPETSVECFLCEMNFISESQLRRHYREHPEQWTFCPLCQISKGRVPIRDHEHMKEHIKEMHLVRGAGTQSCLHCCRSLPERPFNHIIYGCPAIRVCLICTNGEVFASYEGLVKHRLAIHGRVGDGSMSRFQCSLCRQLFYSVGHFRGHSCLASLLPHKCACSSSEVFRDRTQFEVHFRDHLRKVPGGISCEICGEHIQQGKSIAPHRAQHQILERDTSDRRIVVLHENLLVEDETPEELTERKMREQAEQQAEHERQRLLEDSKCVRSLLREALQNVVEGMGEEWEDVPHLASPQASVATDADDDCVMLDSDSPDASRSDAPFQIPRQETDDNRGVGTQESAYFEDGDTNELGEEVSCEAAPVSEVREVVDDNADDDLAVVAEVSHPAGTLPSVVASTSSRSRIQCHKCSQTFFTHGSLRHHLGTAHKFDAGGTSLEDYGIPVGCPVYLCRTCCAAFESGQQLDKHVRDHSATSQYNCDKCAMVAYNVQLLNLHSAAHNERKLTFACHECKITFNLDSELCGHLEERHGSTLLYFCKLCNYANTNGLTVAEHVQARRCRPCDLSKSVECYFGVVPANLVHFNPVNESNYLYRRDEGKMQVVSPSLCTHRTFVAPSQAMVACEECHCLMNLASFMAFEEAKLGQPIDVKYTLASSPNVQTPQRRMLLMCQRRNGRAVKYQGYRRGAGVVYPENVPLNSNAVRLLNALGGVASGHATVSKPMGRSIAVVNPTTSRPVPPTATAQIVTRPLHLPLSRQPAPVAQQQRATGIVNPQVVGPTRSRAVAASSAATRNGWQKPSGQQPSEQQPRRAEVISLSDDDDVICEEPSTSAKSFAREGKSKEEMRKLKNRIGENCKICSKKIPNEQVLLLHELHSNGHKFFCLDCPRSLPDEQSAVEHYFQVHVKKAQAKHKPDSHPFRHTVIDVRCPFRNCGFRSDSLVALRQHLHNHQLPLQSSYCQMRFSAKDKCDQHNAQHKKMADYGMHESSCCVLCGTLDMWSKRLPDMDAVLSHIAIHGFRRYFMCRDCSVCFKHDADSKKFVRHFENDHTAPVAGQEDKFECKLCSARDTGVPSVFPKEQMTSHAKDKHYVHGFKKRTGAADGQILVKSGAEMRLLLGMEKIYFQDDPSDID